MVATGEKDPAADKMRATAFRETPQIPEADLCAVRPSDSQWDRIKKNCLGRTVLLPQQRRTQALVSVPPT